MWARAAATGVGVCAFACALAAVAGAAPPSGKGSGRAVRVPAAVSVPASLLPRAVEPDNPELESESSASRLRVGHPVARHTLRLRSLNDRATLFAGLSESEAGFHLPPDVSIAAGGGYVVELVNEARRVWSAGGTVLDSASGLAQMFGTGTDDISDPKILFDAASGRFFASIMDATQGTVVLAVSPGANPLGSWFTYTLSPSACIDQPKLGTSDNVVVVTGTAYTRGAASCNFSGSTYVGGMIWVLNKQEMVSATSVHWASWGPDRRYGAPVAAQAMSATSVGYAATSSPGGVSVYTVSGTPPGTMNLSTATPSTFGFGSVPSAVQPSAQPVATNDSRLLDAFWDGGSLWLVGNDYCTNQGALRSCARVLQVQTGLNSVAHNEWYGFRNTDSFFPALRPDGRGNVVLITGISAADTNPGVIIDAWTGAAWSTATYLRSGLTATTDSRWGDYFGAATDPATPGLVWLGGEYASGDLWQTAVGAWKTNAVAPSVELAGAAPSVGATSATLSGYIDPRGTDSTYWFEYGTSTAYGQSTPQTTVAGTVARQLVNVSLSGLAVGTTYHWRLVGRNAGGTAAVADQTLTTLAPAPLVSYPGGAAGVTASGATLGATVDPQGSDTVYHFEYGTSSSYSSATSDVTLPAASGAQTVTAQLTGLAAATTYHYRIVAASRGGSAQGADRVFVTKAQAVPKPKAKPKKKKKKR